MIYHMSCSDVYIPSVHTIPIIPLFRHLPSVSPPAHGPAPIASGRAELRRRRGGRCAFVEEPRRGGPSTTGPHGPNAPGMEKFQAYPPHVVT